MIDSPANPRVKAWAALSKRSVRDATGTFLVEGEREAVRASRHLEVLTSILRLDRADVDLPHPIVVSERAFDRISARQNPDGIAVVVKTPVHLLATIERPSSGLYLVADGIEKPGNIGAILRTADGFGAAFIGAGLGTDVVNPNAVRAAQGSLFSTPIATAPLDDAVAWCHANTAIVVADPTALTSLWDADLGGAQVSIVIGSEHAGVHPRWLEVGTSVSVPLSGSADSLNASVAAAVFLAEATRQRRV